MIVSSVGMMTLALPHFLSGRYTYSTSTSLNVWHCICLNYISFSLITCYVMSAMGNAFLTFILQAFSVFETSETYFKFSSYFYKTFGKS